MWVPCTPCCLAADLKIVSAAPSRKEVAAWGVRGGRVPCSPAVCSVAAVNVYALMRHAKLVASLSGLQPVHELRARIE